jgi:NAD+ kinase
MTVLIFYNPLKLFEKQLDEIIELFEKENIRVTGCIPAQSKISEEMGRKSDYFIVFGGDGTVLKVAEKAAIFSKPIICVNTGNLGFLSAYSGSEIKELINDIKEDNLHFSKRGLLECLIGSEKYLALNDIVLIKSQPLGTIDIEVKVDGYMLHSFLADGIIISTSTGSTAYSLSAGGPIINPNLNVIEIVPLAAHALNIKPLIIEPTHKIEVFLKTISHDFAYVTGDGDVLYQMNANESFVVTGSEKYIKLAQKNNGYFFEALKQKLGFGRRFE